jgi:hypothetical protein
LQTRVQARLQLSTVADDNDDDNLSDISDDEENDGYVSLSDEEDGLNERDDHHSAVMKSISFRSPHHHSLKHTQSQRFQQSQLSSSALKSAVSRNYSYSSINMSGKEGSRVSGKSTRLIPGTSNTSFRTNIMRNNYVGSSSSSPSLNADSLLSKSAVSNSALVSSKSRRPFFQAPLPLSPPPLPEGLPPSTSSTLLPADVPRQSSLTSQKSSVKWPGSHSSRESRKELAFGIQTDGNAGEGGNFSVGASPSPFLGSQPSTGHTVGSSPNLSSAAALVSSDDNSVPSNEFSKKARKTLAFAPSGDPPQLDISSHPLDNGSVVNDSATLLSAGNGSSIVSARTLGVDDPAHRGLGWKYFVSVYHHGKHIPGIGNRDDIN